MRAFFQNLGSETEAEHENLTRSLLDLERLRELALLQLETLAEEKRSPAHPVTFLPAEPLPRGPVQRFSHNVLICWQPKLGCGQPLSSRSQSALASFPPHSRGSARSRALPCCPTSANGLLKLDQAWTLSIHPRMAAIAEGRAATNEAAALYRKRPLIAFQEVESSYLI